MPDLVVIGMCTVCFIGALPYITQVNYFQKRENPSLHYESGFHCHLSFFEQGGIYLMHLTDYYVATVAVILLALIVAFSTGVLYGAGRLARNIREMTAHSPSPLLIICWAALTPLIILVNLKKKFSQISSELIEILQFLLGFVWFISRACAFSICVTLKGLPTITVHTSFPNGQLFWAGPCWPLFSYLFLSLVLSPYLKPVANQSFRCFNQSWKLSEKCCV